MKIKEIIILLLALPLLLLCSCKNEKYRDDISCKELCDAIKSNTEKEYARYGSDYLSYILKDTSYCNDSSVIYSTDAADIDEFGILHAKNESDAEHLYEMLNEYITEAKTEQRAFIASYAPGELSKLDAASVERFGNYVFYSFADDDGAKKAISAITSALAE